MKVLQNVLVPVDFSGDSLYALQHACEIARPFGARLHLVHVLESSVLVPPGVGTSSAQVSPERFLRDAESRLEDLVAGWGLGQVTTEVCLGDAAERIVSCARARAADLIVMGTHGARRSSCKLMGRTAEKVVRLSESPVLTVRHRTGGEGGDSSEEHACFDGPPPGRQAEAGPLPRG